MSIAYLAKNIRKLVWGQAAVLFAILLFIIFRHYNPNVINIDLGQCISEYASFNNGEYFFDETVINCDTWVDALVTGNIPIQAGSYTLHMDYECNADKEFAIYDGTVSNAYLRGDTGWLRSINHSADYKFRSIVDLNSLLIKIKYEPYGYLKIKNMSISTNTDSYKKEFIILLVLFALLDIVLLNKEFVKKNIYIVLGILGTVVLASLPLFIPGIAQGHDLSFALLRIESICSGLKEGNFPVRMSSVFLRGYGYPVSVYYGDILLYIPALFRIVGFSVLESWKLYIFMINLASALIGYFSFRKICGNKYIALTVMCAYLTAPYRMYNMYVRAACGEFTAMTFYPLIAYAVYRIYTEKPDKKSSRHYSTILALGFSAVICSHILSTEILCFVMCILAIIMYKKTFTASVLKTYGLGIIKTMLISSYFIVPFLDYYLSVPAGINDTVANTTKTMQEAGAYLNEYLISFGSMFGSGRPVASPGIVLSACLVIGTVIYINNRNDRILGISLFMSALILLLATAIFPWDYFAYNTFTGKILSQIQLPTRFIGISIVFLTIAASRIAIYEKSLNRLHIYQCLAIIGSVLSIALFTGSYEQQMGRVSYYNTWDMDSMDVGRGEYALIGTDTYRDMDGQITENNKNLDMVMEKQGTSITITCNNPDKDKNVKIIVPRYDYKGYHVYDDEGNEYTIVRGDNNLISFWVPAGYNGNIYVEYKVPWYWHLSEIVSCLGITSLIFEGRNRIAIHGKKKRVKENDTGDDVRESKVA